MVFFIVLSLSSDSWLRWCFDYHECGYFNEIRCHKILMIHIEIKGNNAINSFILSVVRQKKNTNETTAIF